MKKLIVYYSYEGRTAYLANNLAKHIEADILVLQPIKEKKTKGFFKFVWGGYQAVMNKKPALESYTVNANEYEFIIFASPVWAGSYAPPLKSFFGQEDILAKKVAYFYTHEGGKGKTETRFKEALSDNHIVGSLDILAGKVDRETNLQELKTWVNTLEI